MIFSKFFKLRFKLFILFFLLLNGLEGLNNEKNHNNYSKKCLIHSKKYNYEFFVIDSNGENIYSRPFEMVGNFSNVIWWLVPAIRNENIETQTPSNNNNDQKSSAVKTFYLKNYQTGDYVCASNRFEIMFITRFKAFRSNNRLLSVVDGNKNKELVHGNTMCQWKFERTTKISNFFLKLFKSWNINKMNADNHDATTKNEYIISNVKTNENLFTALDTLKYGQSRRHVYLMPSQKIDSLWSNDQFKWIVDCGLP